MYCISVIVFSWLWFLFDMYISLRQRAVIKKTKKCPEKLLSIYNKEIFEKARLYALDKMDFGLVQGVYEQIKSTLFLYYGVMAIVWYISEDHLGAYNQETKCTMLYLLYFSLFSFVESMPWSVYSTFVLEQKHGFNKQTIGFFIKDKIKGLILSTILTMLISAALIAIIRWGGDYFYIAAYVFVLVVCLVMMYIYPEFIAPLFDRYESFPETPLRQKIYDLASRVEFPLKKLLIVEGSKRSSHSNAYFYGFGSNKRIVLFDTLIKDFVFPGTTEDPDVAKKGCEDDEEILAILGHEIGHWKCNHLLHQLSISQGYLFIMFYVFSLMINSDAVFVDFGFKPNTTPSILKLSIIFQHILVPFSAVFSMFQTWLTRVNEFQADRFSIGLGYGNHLKSGLLVLCKDNLSFPCNDWLYSTVNFTHPPVIERLAAIDVEMDSLKKKE